MKSDWILDVLTDLKTFALSNQLPQLAEQLDDAALVAMAEIASVQERKIARAHGNKAASGIHSGEIGTSEIA